MPAVRKREEELARPRERKGGDVQPVTHGDLKPVTWDKPADPQWHEIARDIYESARTSGQADYYQDSDWAVLYWLCSEISYHITPQTWIDKDTGEERTKARSGQYLASIMSSLNSLILTEGERRKVRIELQKASAPPPNLYAIGQDTYAGLGDG